MNEEDSSAAKNALADLLPNINYSLKTIHGNEKSFEATFLIGCKTEDEVDTFVAQYMDTTKDVLRAATTK